MKKIIYLMFLLTSAAYAQSGKPQVFTHMPSSFRDCDNRYYLSQNDKRAGRMIWVDNFKKGILMINGHEEKLKSLKFPDKFKYGFWNKNYTVSIKITHQHSTPHVYSGTGLITVYRGNRVILSGKVLVAGGC